MVGVVVLTLYHTSPLFFNFPKIFHVLQHLKKKNHLIQTLPSFPASVFTATGEMERGMEMKRASGKEKGKKEVVMEEEGEEEEEEGEDEKRKRGGVTGSGKKGSSSGSGPCCQAEKCSTDLTNARRYHRRHRVCEHHSKAPIVLVAGLRQRFCQQCSRFHELSEFDESKRSCRRRLAGHNERRRKSSSDSQAGEGGAGGRKGNSPNLKESLCRQSEQSGRMPMALPGSPTYKHFQIR